MSSDAYVMGFSLGSAKVIAKHAKGTHGYEAAKTLLDGAEAAADALRQQGDRAALKELKRGVQEGRSWAKQNEQRSAGPRVRG